MVETEPDPMPDRDRVARGRPSRRGLHTRGATGCGGGARRRACWSSSSCTRSSPGSEDLVPFDEVVLLQYSKYLSGAGAVTPPRGAGYFPAWSVVMAPIWWFTENPAVAYRVAIGLGVVVAVATIWPLARAVTRLGLTVPQATVVASLVMALPARTVQSGYVTSEKLLFLALACTCSPR